MDTNFLNKKYKNKKIRRLSSPLFIVINIIILKVFFLLQTILDMGPGEVHIDEETYLDPSRAETCGISRGYFCLTSALDYKIELIILLNIFFYLMTSYILYGYAKKVKTRIGYILLLIIILDAYRMHLALHVLKDTIVIFLVVTGLHVNKMKIYMIFSTIGLRAISLLYYSVNIEKIKYILFFGVILVGVGYYFHEGYILKILDGGGGDMKFKDYDMVPRFNEYGIMGDVIRSIIWPILTLTGLVIIYMHNIIFIPIFLSIAALNAWSYAEYKKNPLFNKNILIVLSVFAFLVPGYTSYIRYVYPILTVAPVLMMRRYL